MPLTKLDERVALVVIDLQRGIVAMPTVHPVGAVIERAARLAKAFREHGLPVVLVHVTGGAPGRTEIPRPQTTPSPDWAELVPELGRAATDHVITKQRWGAFIGTTLDADLRRLGVTQIVLAGVATSIGVESTARSAFDAGYNVVLVVDAITDRDEQSHRQSVEKIFPRLGEMARADEVLAMLARRSK